MFSVVIAAYNEEKNVAGCLDSVTSQTLPRTEYEIILVDNNSQDKTKDIAQTYPIKVVEEKRQGYVHALRRGVREARGEILVFTDADTVVPKNWLESYKGDFLNSKIVMSGGYGKFRPKTFFSRIAEKTLYLSGQLLKLYCSYNLAVKKTVYDQVGGFNEKINFNVDTDIEMRVKRVGEACFNSQNPVVTSSRRYKGFGGAVYVVKGVLNTLSLHVFGKTLFYEFGDVRD